MRIWIKFLVSMGLALALSGCFESKQKQFNRAVALYAQDIASQENIIEARDILQSLSKEGGAKSQYMLVRMYIRGDGLTIDMRKALDLLLESSANGNGDAYFYASRFYLEDDFGQERNESLARQLISKYPEMARI